MFHVERRKKRGSRLTENITSSYIAASAKLYRRDEDRVLVYVEGYEDIAFWRGLLNNYETDKRKFEISTPLRGDLAKGKKVVLSFAEQAGENLLLCVDSDFDYLFDDYNEQSRLVNSNRYIIQTYAYAIENLMCYAPSLSSIAVRATKNDARIFDFDKFMISYSETIFPLFLWYIYAAKNNIPSIFPLSDFRNSVRVNYLDVDNDGESTIEWLTRQVNKKLRMLEGRNGNIVEGVAAIEVDLELRGVTPQTTYLYMQGHCLMDNVVKVVLASVCDALRKQWVNRIMQSTREGLTLRNELSYYNNSLRDIDTLLLDNTVHRNCEQFRRIVADLEAIYPVRESEAT